MKWAFDVYHSSVTFTIRHMMSKVRGQMKIKEGWLEVDNDNLSTATVDVVLDAATKLNRKDYDLTWNQGLEAGCFILGDEVKLEIGVEAVPAPTPAEAQKEIEAEAALESR